ncbi:LOW QUALITY PROTEIN: WD repeat-containing protein 3 [Dioscorea cayenensis subsp. rotundata]|uniref:LOW QUALITY PROTEIN: WD repeat-containing protein 3 n=1 Tax=Dioscorea cayennensis subsp. rotundata TaxID=55577 RepID=A0AB40CDT5_DIOCR|nr:LOW QUALITY PROTEIN: WD repeat-containing protein 3 [Dioscorea cayenensis subsp. rotundata]
MVKAYLRYEPALAFGVITSTESNITYDSTGSFLLSAALDSLAIWNYRQGILSKLLSSSPRPSHSLAVTSIAASSSGSIATGHADGSVRLWDVAEGCCVATLNGHRSAVTALRFNKQGSMLASGSKDCDIILWDAVSEAGLFRLQGHRDQVTDLVFLDSGKKLVSCSKDKFARVWDLDTQHCMQIVSGQNSEIWSLDVDPEERYLVIGSADKELHFYQIKLDAEVGEDSNKWDVLKQFGEIQRKSEDRVATVRFNKTGSLLACQVAGKTVEVYRVLSDAEAKHKAKRRIRRKKEKVVAKAETDENTNGNAETQQLVVIVSDVFKLLHILRASKKISSIAFCPVTSKGSLATLSLSLNNNMLETHLVDDSKITKTHAIELHGHRSDIRSLSLSSDNTLLMSTSHNAVKIWNPSTGSCLRTVDSGYGLCSAFVPTNRHALVGTKNGTLEVIDVGSGTCIEMVEAHAGAVRSVVNCPDGSGFVTGSADHDVKFWEYQLLEDSKQLTVANTRTLKMNDDVLAISLSPDGKYVAVALLDCTIKVFFMDTLKFFLSLYGHKLPVLCTDISSDGALIVSGSADKNMKIWGLDFGDCHKSIFAHNDSVMAVQFVHNTHYVFSVGKDRLVKYWDADKFELLLTLEGHHAEVWCLAISNRGDFIVTGSHDRSIRRWDRTEEPFFIEEEREKRLEQMFESDMDYSNDRYAPREDLPEEGSVGLPGKKTQETLTAADSILEAIDIAEEELKRIEQHKEDVKNGATSQFQPNIMMRGLSPSDYVINAISSVHTNDLEQTLLSLPFTDALKLLSYMKDWATRSDKVELVCKVNAILLQTHHNQLTATPSAKHTLTVLKDILPKKAMGFKNTIGVNNASMEYIKELMSMRSDAPFRDAKAKLLEIRLKQSKHDGRKDGPSKRKKKKLKVSSENK